MDGVALIRTLERRIAQYADGLFRHKRALRWLPAGLVCVLILLSLAFPRPAGADGGGIPSRTPTRTSTLTSGNVPVTATLFPPTATNTLQPAAAAQDQQEQLLAPNVVAAPETARPFSVLSCWPFALVVLLVLIIGVMWLKGRFQGNTA